MKEQLIKLAKEKGFESKAIIFQYGANPAKLTIQEAEFSYYLWMCELQKWLREIQNFHVVVEPIVKTIELDLTFRYYGLKFEKSYADITEKGFKSYKEVLEQGLFEALKLIK